MEDAVKSWLVKDDKLIIHLGRKDIPQTKFFVLNRTNAKEVRRLIDDFIKEGPK